MTLPFRISAMASFRVLSLCVQCRRQFLQPTNLFRLIRQDRLDFNGIAAHLHGAAPPDKHRESARFMEPLLSEILQTLKRRAPVAKLSEQVNNELQRAKRKLQEAGLEAAAVTSSRPGQGLYGRPNTLASCT